MSSEEILNPEEVDFLLGGAGEDEPVETAIPTDVEEVTMRGDLDQVGLADIFQTLSVSKMEGILRVRNPLDQREVHFKDGLCRCLLPPRAETRRLGQFLIRAGLITTEQLRSALVAQKKSKRPIGQVLVEEGLVEPEEIERIATGQVTEDLFALFTWQHGTFEFYKGAVLDVVLNERLERLPQFEVGSLLLEVARRSDEWEGIIEAVRSLDEVPVINPLADDLDEYDLGSEHQAVLESVDGCRTIRDLAGATMLGLFASSRACRDLYGWGLLQHADEDRLLELAESWIGSGERKRALVTVQTLHDRDGDRPVEIIQAMAQLLKRCGETKLASGLLMELAHEGGNGESAVGLAREALSLSARDPEILRFLAENLFELSRDSELPPVLTDLFDACLETGDLDAAEEALGQLERFESKPSVLLARRAVLLQRRKDDEGAIAAYDELVEIHRESGNQKALAETYERILKLDHDRKDVVRALRALRTTRASRIRRYALGGVVVLSSLGYGWWEWNASVTESRIQELSTTVAGHIRNGELKTAQAALDAAGPLLELDDPRIAGLRSDISGAFAVRESAAKRKRNAAFQRTLEKAAEDLEEGDALTAFTLYRELRDNHPKQRKTLDETIQVRIDSIIAELMRLGRVLPFSIPDAPTVTTKVEEVEAAIATLQKNFPPSLVKRVEGLTELEKAAEELPALIPTEQREVLFEQNRAMRTLLAKAMTRLSEFEDANNEAETRRKLNPLFIAAREHEAAYRFEDAFATYKKLVAAKARDPHLERHFRDQMERYATICRYLQLLREATAKGDFEVARGQLRALQRVYAEIPFETLVRLPLRLESRPEGADVVVDGKKVATTPTWISYIPGVVTKVEIRSPGFRTAEAEIQGDKVGRFVSLLSREPGWKTDLATPMDHRAAHSTTDTIVVDRKGQCIRLLPDGTESWRRKFDDLSAYLPTPATAGARVLLTSLDGKVRLLDRETGDTAWEREDLPTEQGPAVRGNIGFVLTNKGDAVALDLTDGKTLWSHSVPRPVHSDPVAIPGGFFAVGSDGKGRAWSDTGKELWNADVSETVVGRPALSPDGALLVIAADSGTITCLKTKTGEQAWRTTGLGDLTRSVATSSTRTFVTTPSRLLAFDLATGKAAGSRDGRFTNAPAVAGNRLVCATKNGDVQVLDVESLDTLYRLQVEAAVGAPLSANGEGGWAVVTESGLVLGFGPLP